MQWLVFEAMELPTETLSNTRAKLSDSGGVQFATTISPFFRHLVSIAFSNKSQTSITVHRVVTSFSASVLGT